MLRFSRGQRKTRTTLSPTLQQAAVSRVSGQATVWGAVSEVWEGCTAGVILWSPDPRRGGEGPSLEETEPNRAQWGLR